MLVLGIEIVAGNTFHLAIGQLDHVRQGRHVPVTTTFATLGISIVNPKGMAGAAAVATMMPDTRFQIRNAFIGSQGTIVARQASGRRFTQPGSGSIR